MKCESCEKDFRVRNTEIDHRILICPHCRRPTANISHPRWASQTHTGNQAAREFAKDVISKMPE